MGVQPQRRLRHCRGERAASKATAADGTYQRARWRICCVNYGHSSFLTSDCGTTSKASSLCFGREWQSYVRQPNLISYVVDLIVELE